jgi:hypothetical protein
MCWDSFLDGEKGSSGDAEDADDNPVFGSEHNYFLIANRTDRGYPSDEPSCRSAQSVVSGYKTGPSSSHDASQHSYHALQSYVRITDEDADPGCGIAANHSLGARPTTKEIVDAENLDINFDLRKTLVMCDNHITTLGFSAMVAGTADYFMLGSALEDRS